MGSPARSWFASLPFAVGLAPTHAALCLWLVGGCRGGEGDEGDAFASTSAADESHGDESHDSGTDATSGPSDDTDADTSGDDESTNDEAGSSGETGSTGTTSGDSGSSGDDEGTDGSSGGTSAGTGGEGDPNEDGWAIVEVGTDEDLIAIDFADASHGWLVGTNEVLLHTADGGDSWQSQEDGFWTATANTKQLQAHALAPGPAWGVYHLLDVHAVDPDVAWVASIGPLESPIALDPDHLTAVFVTKDGGDNWTRLTLATNFQVWGVHGFGGSSARAATIGSTDHPDSDVYHIEAGANQASVAMTWSGLRDITFVDAQRGWAVGAGIYFSDDAGASWNQQDAPGSSWWAVTFVDESHGWVVGEGGAIATTSNGGQTWQAQVSGTQIGLYGVSFVDDQRGFAVGDAGVVLATHDGGQSWVAEDPGTAKWINDVVALSAEQAWATADAGVLLHRVP